jgi:hypothetical protein
VFAAYVDVTFDEDLASASLPITFGSFFSVLHSGAVLPGEVLGAGGMTLSLQQPGPAEQFLFSLPFHADQVGQLLLTPGASPSPGHDFLLFVADDAIPSEQIQLVPATLTIVPEPSSIVLVAFSGCLLAMIGLRRRLRAG